HVLDDAGEALDGDGEPASDEGGDGLQTARELVGDERHEGGEGLAQADERVAQLGRDGEEPGEGADSHQERPAGQGEPERTKRPGETRRAESGEDAGEGTERVAEGVGRGG